MAEGIFQGKTLAEVLELHTEYLGTRVCLKIAFWQMCITVCVEIQGMNFQTCSKVKNGELPVLVKFIGAEKNVSAVW